MSQIEESCSIFEKYDLHKNYFLLFLVFCFFAVLKYLSQYEFLGNFVMGVIAISPFILAISFFSWLYLKDRRNHALYELMVKHDVFLKLAFKLSFAILVMLIVLFPNDWKPLLQFFDVVRKSFSLEIYFLLASYLAVFILSGELVSFFIRVYQISRGTYHHTVRHVFKKTLYSTFFISFLLLLFSVLTYPEAFFPITDALADGIFTVSQGAVALSKLSGGELEKNNSLLMLAKSAFSKTSSNLAGKMDTTQLNLSKTVALSRDALVQSVADTSKNLTDSINGKVSLDGGKISGAIILSGKNSDLTVEGTTTTRDIIPDSNLTYNLGEAGKSWNTMFVHRLIGASPVFIGDGSSKQGLTNDGDLVVSHDLEVQGTIYASQIVGLTSGVNATPFTGGEITSSIIPNGSGINLGSSSNHFATIYANNLVGVPLNFLPLSGGTLSGNLNLGNHSFTTFNSALVNNLNADLLDGNQASAFALLVGRAGGQTLNGDSVASGNLLLSSTSNAVKGKIVFGNSAYDEKNNRLGIGTDTPGALLALNNSNAGQKALIVQGAQNQTANLMEIYGYDSGNIANGQTFDNAPVFDSAHVFDNAPTLTNLTFDSAPSGLSAAANYNSSSDYLAYNNSHTLRIYAYKVLSGIKIFDATPIDVLFNDDNSGRPYTISWSWTEATGADGYRLFKAASDGSANFDKYADVVGTSFYDTGAGDFSYSGTFDGRTSLAYDVNYGSGSAYTANGNQHQLIVYAYEMHNGVKIFNNSPLHIIPQIDSSARTFSLDYTWTAAAGADGYRVFDYDSAAGIYASRYEDITNATFHDASQSNFTNSGTFNGATSYTDGHVINYGSGSAYTANGQTHGVRVYSYKTYSGTKIFNPSYAEASFVDNNGGQYYTIDWSWTGAAGADGYRVFDFDSGNSINFNKYIDVTATNFQDTSASSYTHSGAFDGMTEYTGSMLASISADGHIDATGFSINGVALGASGGWGGIVGDITTQTDLMSKLGEKLNLAGGTMTGALGLPINGLAVGSNQLVVLNGAVGIGTATPSASYQLTVNGDVNVTNGLLRFSGTQIGLNNLKNVTVGSPALNQVLAYNGTNWVNTTFSSVSAGNIVSFYLQTQSADISPFKQLLTTPGAGSEVDANVVVSNNLGSPTLIEEYISSAVGLGGSQIDAGEWEFDTFGYVSDASGDSEIQMDVFTRATDGTETLQFSSSTGPIANTSASAQEIAINSFQPAFNIAPSDRLVVKYSAKTDLLSSTTVHLLHNGQTHYSHFHTPMLTRHNDMAGLQGGTSQQYYHLTSAEYTGTGTGNFVRQASPTFTGTVSGVSAAMVGLGNVTNESKATMFTSPTFTGTPVLNTATATTLNGLAITNNGTNILNIAAGKTLTMSNTLTFTGTDSSTLNIGTGGTLGTSAYTAAHNAVTLGTANGLSLSTQQLSLGLASNGVTGALSGTDWATFNNKQAALSYGSAGTIAYSNGSALAYSAVGSAGQCLVSGASGAPTWGACGGSMAIGGSITSATASSILFAGASGVLAEDSTNFAWDDTNIRLKIGASAGVLAKNIDPINYGDTASGLFAGNISLINLAALPANSTILSNLSEDSSISLAVNNGGTSKELMRLDGATDEVNVGSGSTLSMIIDTNGNVGIGDATPVAALTVGDGDLFQVSSSGAITASTGYNQYSGDFNIGGTGTFTTNSGANALVGSTTWISGDTTIAANKNLSMYSGTGTFSTGTGAISLNGTTTIAANKNLTMTSGTGTFSTGTGTISLNGATTLAANQNFAMTSGTGTSLQTFTGTTTVADTITANSLSSGTILSLTSTSTAAIAGNKGLNIAISGANGTSAITRYGLYSTVTATNATSGTNTAGYFSASGATTTNYGLYVNAGSIYTPLGNGSVTVSGGVLVSSSDERLKDIQGPFSRGLEAIMGINPILYKWNEKSGLEMETLNAGFSAQNIQSVIPEAVDTDSRGYLTLSDRPIIGALVNSIKTQQLEISDLTLKTDGGVTTLTDLQTSVDTQLGVVGKSLNSINTQLSVQTQSIASLQTKSDNYENLLKAQEDLAVTLQAQIMELQKLTNQDLNVAQLEADTTDISYLKTLLGVDNGTNPGDISLLGKLSATGVETGKLVIKVVDPEVATIGSATILKDTSSIEVETKAVTKDSKIFTSFESNPGAASWIDKKMDNDGKYTGFTINLDTATVSKDVKANWWIVEERQ